jgi:hypothetical protein
MCCYDGTFVEEDELVVLDRLFDTRTDEFSELGISIPLVRFEESRWPNPGTQTVLVDHTFPARLEMPPHFETGRSCFLLTNDGRCSLELLAENENLHRWHYKPIACWLYPILHWVNGHPAFRLFSEEDDPYVHEGYEGFVNSTRCSATDPEGPRATDSLADELDYAAAMCGRVEAREVLVAIRSDR